jgi:hypothetical protein
MSVLYNFSSLTLKISKTQRFCTWSYPQILEKAKSEKRSSLFNAEAKKDLWHWLNEEEGSSFELFGCWVCSE